MPVVATAVGGVPEIVEHGETGLLVDGSAGDLVGALEKLTSCRALLDRLGENALSAVTDRFGLQDVVERTEGLMLSTQGQDPDEGP